MLAPGARPQLSGEVALSVAGSGSGSGELRVSAQRIDATGGSAALPLEVELVGPASSKPRRLDEVGGATVFDLDSPSWTLVVRRRPDPDAQPADVAAGPLGGAADELDQQQGSDAPAADPGPTAEPAATADPSVGRRRRRGSGESPLDRL